jgi:predicted transglutaminase-like cysteine proteinase
MDIAKLNKDINASIRYEKERNGWGSADGIGNCQAIAAAKYSALRKAGIPARMVFVQSGEGPHVVVEANGVILDNQTQDILPLLERKDLIPAYYFDNNGVYKSDGEKVGGINLIPKWDAYLNNSIGE